MNNMQEKQQISKFRISDDQNETPTLQPTSESDLLNIDSSFTSDQKTLRLINQNSKFICQSCGNISLYIMKCSTCSTYFCMQCLHSLQYKFCLNKKCFNAKYFRGYSHRRLVASELEEFQGLLFRCHNYELGCIQTIRLDELNQHQQECQKNQDLPLQLKWLEIRPENKKICFFCCQLRYVRWHCEKTSQEVCYQCKPIKLSSRKCCNGHQLLFQLKSADYLICDNCQFKIITPFWSDYNCNFNLCNYCFIHFM